MHIISSTEEHAQEAKEHVEENASAAHLITTHNVDLGDLAAVKALGDKLASSLERLDQLYLIAGVGVAPFGYTKDGLGNHFAVNNVSQVLMIDLLYPKLQETAKKLQGTGDEGSVRIVSESSELHRSAPSDLKAESVDEFGKQSEDMDPLKLYGRSKLGKYVSYPFYHSYLRSHSRSSPVLVATSSARCF